MEFEPVIAFETHVELKTKTKLFCGCAVSFDAPPNTHICPVCTGQPGALPVLNKKAVQYTVRAGLALNCTINRKSRFARKNYFYPDLPKGYQISQYELPFCQDGYLEITTPDGSPYAVGIKRIHLEEDAGKLVHSSSSFESSEYSLVDFNRACVPLLEIVTDHERNPLRSPVEARAYLEKLIQVLRYLDISECAIEKGQFRCDVNVSVRPRGSKAFGNRAEIKNMASFKAIMDALGYEIERQSESLRSGRKIPQETRLFDEAKRITVPMRSKEDAPDYRYFPDPDLVDVELDLEFIERIKKTMPELPDQEAKRLTEEYGIPRSEVLILTRDKHVSNYFASCASQTRDRKKLSRWIIKELFKLLNASGIPIEKCPITPKNFSRLINLLSEGEVTDTMGRSILEEMFSEKVDPQSVVAKRGLKPIQSAKVLENLVDQVVKNNPDAVSKIRAGETKPINFLVGRVMQKTQGRADPKVVRDMIAKKFPSRQKSGKK
ncbi:MAG: Asp-tRNA(Asn)/Glu-tRNA(Gln) amidotransferase subunit GatB [Deltaproteobacteria bacterium]|nr:Asp-tRNA(Asn)/Glu-tRNA(Gln) amidotransferase subunit GatB [Deltaproteobacteria bacterium]MBW2300718.1 Asp-tRNA(Asn)/Glu-tRNA(Gln) amidotransferase subunit GatB [Deltaproteobacteria bacterium]